MHPIFRQLHDTCMTLLAPVHDNPYGVCMTGVQLAIRLDQGLLDRVAARGGDGSRSDRVRAVLEEGLRCLEHECAGWMRAAERGARNEALLDELEECRARPSLAVVNPMVAAALSPDPLEPPPDDPVPASGRWPTRGALGRWAANLSDAQLTARGVCPRHNCNFEECAHEHEWSS